MAKPQVLKLGNWPFSQKAWQELEQVAEVVKSDANDRSEFIKELGSGKFDRVVCIARTFDSISSTGRFDAELVKHFPASVKSVNHNGAGYDQIDVGPLSEKKIQLSNVPTLVDAPTADTHIYLMLSALRNFQHGHSLMMQGKWPVDKKAGTPIGHDPEGKVLGIFGMGGIGRAVRDRARPFGFSKIVYHNRNRLSADLEGDAEYVSFEELLKISDVVSINIPLNPATRHSINKEAISKMKDGVVIVNTARGPVIDEPALIEALKSGKVRSCGLDVFENEPQVPQELMDLPNCVSLPHLGTHTYETMQKMEEFVVENARAFIEGGKVKALAPEQKQLF